MNILNIPGNLGALMKWAEQFSSCQLIDQGSFPDPYKKEIICLPGGNLGSIPNQSLSKQLFEFLKNGGRIFAICGAFQALFSSSEENKCGQYLSIFPAKAYRLKKPNIGFNRVISDWYEGDVYFNCKYSVYFKEGDWNHLKITDLKIATDKEGYLQAIRTPSVLGVQFHPELSFGNFDQVFKNWAHEK